MRATLGARKIIGVHLATIVVTPCCRIVVGLSTVDCRISVVLNSTDESIERRWNHPRSKVGPEPNKNTSFVLIFYDTNTASGSEVQLQANSKLSQLVSSEQLN